MKLYKGRKNKGNYIEKSEQSFMANVKDMLMENHDTLVSYEKDLRKNGLSITKVLRKNSVNSIDFTYEKDTWDTYTYGIKYFKDIELEDVLCLCEIAIIADKESRSFNHYIGQNHQRYKDKIESLLNFDLHGMYEIVDDKIIDKEGSVFVKDSDLVDDVKIQFLKYYNFTATLQDKKDVLKRISNLIEKEKDKLPNKRESLFDRNIQGSINSFMDIVNNIDGIRHSNHKTMVLEEDKELILMNLAMNNAFAILTYISNWLR